MRALVLQIYNCIACLGPEKPRQPLAMQHGLRNTHYVVVLALNYPILQRIMGCNELSLDALFGTQVPEVIGYVLPFVIRPQGFYLLVGMIFN